MSDLVNFFLTWADNIDQKYHINPWIFIGIYLATIPFTWWIFFKIISKLRRKDSRGSIYWISVELILLALPYIYVVLFIENVTWVFRAILISILILTGVTFFKKVDVS